MTENPSYYAIITANIRYDKRLKPNEKLMYSEITALANKEGYCHASNKYFAELYDVVPQTVSKWISHLEQLGYVQVELVRKDNQIVQRKIHLGNQTPINKKINTSSIKSEEGINEKVKNPINKKVKGNITSINNTSINKKRPKSKPTYGPDDQNYQLAKLLLDKIRENNPNTYPSSAKRQPDLQSWANTIRLMHERDSRSYDQIKNMIDWCQDNNFWQSNILSASSLREKYPVMAAQANRELKGTRKPYDHVNETTTDWSKVQAKQVSAEQLAVAKAQYKKVHASKDGVWP